MAKFWAESGQKKAKNQKIKNPLCSSLDNVHMKLCTHFFDNLVIQCLKKVVPVEKKSHFLKYRISYIFRDIWAKYPSRYRP